MSLERVIEKIRDNDVVLWVGAGFSLDAGLPSANTLREMIINDCSDEEKVYFENQSLSEVASTFVALRNGSRNQLHNILQKSIDITPTSLKSHQLVSEIPQIDIIITTNYDRLFEEAYGREISTIINDSQIPLATKRTQLYKIHGDIQFPESIVLTTNDYTDFFRNHNKPMWNKVKTLLAEKTIVFIGYSISDQNIDFLFENVINDLGSFQKEPYLIAPNLPRHILTRLSQKNVNYINMTGLNFIEAVHKEIKKNLLNDIVSSKIPSDTGLNFLKEKHSMNAVILRSPEGSSISSIGSYDETKKLNLNMKFNTIDFLEIIDKHKFDDFEISGEYIDSIKSNFEGIQIPSNGKIKSLKIIPQAQKKFDIDLYFKGSDIVLSDLLLEIFHDSKSSLFKFSHPIITFKFNSEEKLFNFSINKINRLRDLEDVIQFLITLVLGKEQLVIYFKEDNEELDFIQMNENENIDLKNQFFKLEKIVSTLKSIQRYYQIIFRNFDFNITDETLETLEILDLHMNKDIRSLESITLSTETLVLNKDMMDYETFTEKFIINKNSFAVHFKEKIQKVVLFEQEIEINDHLNTVCHNIHVAESSSYINPLTNEKYLNLKLKSNSDDNESILQSFDISKLTN